MPPSIDRRSFLRAGLAGSVLLSAGIRRSVGGSADSGFQPRSDAGRARNVIFLVSDGMSAGTLTMADMFLRRHRGRGSHWLDLHQIPGVRVAVMDTASANSLVTDSAAASSAWGCGQRVHNSVINIAPDGRPLTPIYHLAAEAGVATGLVTTATVTHATPAGFAAQMDDRMDEESIALQYLDARIDVLLGGGSDVFAPATRADRRDLFAEFAAAGYELPRCKSDLQTLDPSRRVLGVFATGHLPYALDHDANPGLRVAVPTLAEMSRAALDRLDRHPRGFILQIEGARIDHAAHANDIGALIHDQVAFDEAIGVVHDFAAGRDDTLVIVTTDHGNANPGLNGVGLHYGETDRQFDRIADIRQTNHWVLEGMSIDNTAARIRDRVRAGTGIELSSDDVSILYRMLRGRHRETYQARWTPLIVLGQLLSNYVSVGWTGVTHTGDWVDLVAFGPGSESLGTFIHNTDLFTAMTHALGFRSAKT